MLLNIFGPKTPLSDTGFWWEDQKERDVIIDRAIILKWILVEEDGVVWTGIIWLRIGTSGWLLWTQHTSSRLAQGSKQPPIQWVSGALSSVVKRPGREAGHLPPTNAEVKKTWIYTSIPPHVFMAQCLHRTPLPLFDLNSKGEGTPRKLATATQPQFPRIVISLSWTHVIEWSCVTQFPQFALLHSVTYVQLRLITILVNYSFVAVSSCLGVPCPLLPVPWQQTDECPRPVRPVTRCYSCDTC
jgi:hypothetical protein